MWYFHDDSRIFYAMFGPMGCPDKILRDKQTSIMEKVKALPLGKQGSLPFPHILIHLMDLTTNFKLCHTGIPHHRESTTQQAMERTPLVEILMVWRFLWLWNFNECNEQPFLADLNPKIRHKKSTQSFYWFLMIYKDLAYKTKIIAKFAPKEVASE